MDLRVEWLPPYVLQDGRRQLLTYTFDGVDGLPDGPGVYVFGRRHGRSFSPLYLGKAARLSQRIPQQLKQNIRLMNALLHAPSGRRELLIGQLALKGGQRANRVLAVVERGLIKLALAHGHDIVNVQGTRLRSHTVMMSGNRSASSWIGSRTVLFE